MAEQIFPLEVPEVGQKVRITCLDPKMPVVLETTVAQRYIFCKICAIVIHNDDNVPLLQNTFHFRDQKWHGYTRGGTEKKEFTVDFI